MIWQNILSLNPFQPSATQEIWEEICKVLQKYPDNNNIEIEFKYAQFTTFTPSYFDKEPFENKEIRAKVVDICSYYVMQQNQLHLQTLRKLSHSHLIKLNSLGKRVYNLFGCFDETVHKKFYKIRDFLIKLCKQNQSKISSEPNFYSQIQQIFMNNTFKMVKLSELRLDVNVKHGEDAGRYSYLVGQGRWTKTVKENFVKQQFDLMMVQRTFRLAIKKEQEIPVSKQQMVQILNSPAVSKGGVFLRFKRSLRVTKNNEIQTALSEIYQPQAQRRSTFIQDLKDMINFDTEILDDFCKNMFQQFYMWQPKPGQYVSYQDLVSKFQIQSQFLPMGLNRIREYRKKKNFRDLAYYVQTTLHDLYALYYVEHNIKKRQTHVISDIIKDNKAQTDFPECRIQNQFGSYMHDVVYDYMTTR